MKIKTTRMKEPLANTTKNKNSCIVCMQRARPGFITVGNYQ